jgi:hypothetical protein
MAATSNVSQTNPEDNQIDDAQKQQNNQNRPVGRPRKNN